MNNNSADIKFLHKQNLNDFEIKCFTNALGLDIYIESYERYDCDTSNLIAYEIIYRFNSSLFRFIGAIEDTEDYDIDDFKRLISNDITLFNNIFNKDSSSRQKKYIYDIMSSIFCQEIHDFVCKIGKNKVADVLYNNYLCKLNEGFNYHRAYQHTVENHVKVLDKYCKDFNIK